MFSGWKKEDKDVLNQVVCRALDLKIQSTQLDIKSNEFCGVFVDTRPRAVGLIEEFAAFKSFKACSAANYPIFAFLNENYAHDFLNEKLIQDWRITVIPTKNLDCSKNLIEYSDFMLRKLPFLVPQEFKKAIFFQSDGFLTQFGWEDFVNNNIYYFLGAPTRHISSVVFPNRPHLNNKGIINMNGGFSFRRLDIMRELSLEYSSFNCYEYGREDFAPPPEDLWYHYCLNLKYPQYYPSLEDAALFSQDPLRSIGDISKSYGFHSCQT